MADVSQPPIVLPTLEKVNEKNEKATATSTRLRISNLCDHRNVQEFKYFEVSKQLFESTQV